MAAGQAIQNMERGWQDGVVRAKNKDVLSAAVAQTGLPGVGHAQRDIRAGVTEPRVTDSLQKGLAICIA